MTWTNDYLTLDVTADLGGNVDLSELRTEIEPLLTPGISYFVGTDVTVTVKLGAEPDQSEKDAVDAAVATYSTAALDRSKNVHKKKHSDAYKEMVFEHYRAEQQQSLSTYLGQAQFGGLVNRSNYILQALGWIDAGFTLHDAKDDEIDAKLTIADVEAVTWDYSGLEASDPLVNIRTARGILD